MNSNTVQIVDREIADGSIEGVYFGPKVWVIARSPTAMLVWVYGHSWSNNGWQQYAEPHLTLLEDRSPRFLFQPSYRNIPIPGNRLRVGLIPDKDMVRIGSALGIGMNQGAQLVWAIEKRKTLIIDGGGGSLRPLDCYGANHREWKDRGGGFIVRPEGISEWDMYRGKLGWKPKEEKNG